MARSTRKQSSVAVTVDVVSLAVVEGSLQVLLITRGNDPDQGKLALPGGFVEAGEDLAAAATRELAEETGLTKVRVEQLGAYGAPGRDPRGHTVSVVFTAYLPDAAEVTGGDDAAAAGWFEVAGLLRGRNKLAFDHKQILTDAVARLAERLEVTTVATALAGREFTLSDLRWVYQAVWGVELDPGNFQRKVLSTEDFVVPTGLVRLPVGRGRPATLYKARHRDVRRLSTPLPQPGK